MDRKETVQIKSWKELEEYFKKNDWYLNKCRIHSLSYMGNGKLRGIELINKVPKSEEKSK